MNLKSVSEVPDGTKLVLRLDTDLPMGDGQITDNSRLVKSLPTIRELLKKKCKMVVIGYMGKPRGQRVDELTLKPVYLELMSLLESDGQDWVNSVFVDNVDDTTLIDQSLANNEIVFLENVRFWPGEEGNDSNFLKNLTELCSCVVMDAFAVAHRNEISVTMHRRMPAFYGYSFVDEANKVMGILDNPKKPITIILGGAKEDKLNYVGDLVNIADWILIGGKLPLISNDESRVTNEKMIWARLREDGMDLSEEDINKFGEIIRKSKTIIWVGAMGKYEIMSSKRGTEEIARAITEGDSYRIIAGGDTGAAVRNIGMSEKIDLICSGGGAMLQLLTKGSLPAWE